MICWWGWICIEIKLTYVIRLRSEDMTFSCHRLCGLYFSFHFHRWYLCLHVLILKVQLQGIFQSKHVDHFLFQVVELQKQLTVADSVLMVWMEVQRTWAYLESIFKSCDDICQQLPADAHRFQAIDAEFQVCAKISQVKSHVVIQMPLFSSL